MLALAQAFCGGLFPFSSGCGCGQGSEAGMAEIAKQIDGASAVFEDALLCGRDPNAAFTPTGCGTRKVRLPPFCGWYKVTLELEASIPDYAPGFPANHDCRSFFQNRFRCFPLGKTVFEPDPTDAVHSYLQQCCCDTRAIRMTMDLVVGSGAEFTLVPACGMIYPLPATDVSISVKKVEPLIPCRLSKLGDVISALSCARLNAPLGANAIGHSAGCLFFEFDEPTADAFSRHGLSFSWDSSDEDAVLIGDNANGALYQWNPSCYRFETLADGTAASAGIAPRRAYVHECVVDLVDIQDGYEILYYLPSQVARPAGGVLPAPVGNPFRAWRVRNPSGDPADLETIEVTEIGVSTVTLEYDASTGDWNRRTGTGVDQITETVGERPAGTGRVLRFRRHCDADGVTASYRANLCQAFAWGEEIVEERVGVANPHVATHEFYDDAETTASTMVT